MLDVVFNILAFFVMTFQPPAPERNFDALLPPPKVTEAAANPNDKPADDIDAADLFKDVTVTLVAGPGGELSRIRVDNKDIGPITRLAVELRLFADAVKGIGDQKLEAATIVASPGLKYRYIILAVDACHQANITKINFSEAAAAK
jgi:biopolymer transport protein ExbD